MQTPSQFNLSETLLLPPAVVVRSHRRFCFCVLKKHTGHDDHRKPHSTSTGQVSTDMRVMCAIVFSHFCPVLPVLPYYVFLVTRAWFIGVFTSVVLTAIGLGYALTIS